MNLTHSGMLSNGYILLTLLFTIIETHVTQDFCVDNTATLNCPDSHIIKVTSARYGRMKETSHCISQSYKTGCQDDVTERVQSNCWGHKNCSFAVRDFVDLTPCPDLNNYLEVQYTCAPAISLSRCGTDIRLPSDKGYLSLPIYTLSSRQCTWTLVVNKTQHLSLTVEPVTKDTRLLCSSSVSVADLPDKGSPGVSWSSITACPDGNSHYQSKSSSVRLSYTQQQNTDQKTLFLLHYKVYGCPQIRSPPGGWVTQNSSFAMVKCNLTLDTWYLSCTVTEWNGSAGNCTLKGPIPDEADENQDTFPFGIVMAIFLGLLLGIVVGVILLGLVYFYFWYRRKPKSNYQTPDIAGSYYGEDPSHKEMYGTSLDRQNYSTDYSTNYSLHGTCPAHSGSALYSKYTGIISRGGEGGPQSLHHHHHPHTTPTTTLPHPEEMYLKRQHSDSMNT